MPTLGDIMTDEVVYMLPDENVREAAREMKKLNVGIIPVCDDNQRLLGVITDRDIVVRVVAEGRNPDDTQLMDIATTDPISGQRDWDLPAATELMSRYQVRRLPVVEDGRLIGIVSLGDIAVQAAGLDTSATLGEISEPAMPRKGQIDSSDHTT